MLAVLNQTQHGKPSVRKRVTRTKRSRAGCRTCRLRKVKCDETPGTCQRCASSGRICDGYDLHRLPPATGRQNIGAVMPRLQPSIASHRFRGMTSDERRCFSYFRNRQIPATLMFFDSALWKRLVLQMAQAESAVYHAMIALSAVHLDTEIKEVLVLHPEVSPDSALHLFALEQLGRSYAQLQLRCSSQDPYMLQVTLVTCLLYVMLDMIQGQYETAFTHMQSGLRILKDLTPFKRQQDPFTASDLPVEGCLVAGFAFLDIGFMHFDFDGPPRLHLEEGLDFERTLLARQGFITSLQEGRQAYNIIASALFQFLPQCWHLSDADIAAQYHRLQPRQIQLLSQTGRMLRIFDAFHAQHYSHLPPQEQQGFDILIYHIHSFLLALKICLVGSNHAARAAYTADFQSLLVATQRLMHRFLPDRPSVTLDLGILPTLHLISTFCPDYRLRLQAFNLLKAWPHREGPFDSDLTAALAMERMRKELTLMRDTDYHSHNAPAADRSISKNERKPLTPAEIESLLAAISPDDHRFFDTVDAPAVATRWACFRIFFESDQTLMNNIGCAVGRSGVD
ncbi:Zn(II)2Cys6 transcription factor [Aspergillus homomorphus CBS 101889]|uniref:Zn(2)-C6 fungal-type domain-containing protein n=1 Tax=Aspergillus homomorphus (strain CBS 101889) TaxID=1450537 RepID=A0A395I5E1_ASPHC|nr:hypothetical protein BO97DRAFT_475800 [Aspergillus homomorphus CBS 101889]RAL15421.1 hypothetical protein BO97DRAFT_475800 [Aspergillus homomorphus CBS 101889]